MGRAERSRGSDGGGSTINELVVVSLESTGEQERRLLDLASWMGVPGNALATADRDELIARLSAAGERDKVCLALSADTLVALGHCERVRNVLRAVCRELLVFGIGGGLAHRQALRWLTRDTASARSNGERSDPGFSVPEGSRAFSQQLAGSSFTSGDGALGAALELSMTPGVEAIMLQDGAPVFARVPTEVCPVFMVAQIPMPDLGETLSAGQGLGNLYVRLIPPLIFLRHAFGDACWHGIARTARVIIDDPVLRRHYGFLDFERLARSIRTTGCGVTIGFIPWNYRRTSARMASMFGAHAPDLDICIHGCDHTDNEFGARDRELLTQKAGLAMRRMEAHESRTRIPFEPVMVFPQGRFSEEALEALRATGYVAAVDSSCHPTAGGATRLTVADFLRPAVTFGGFPVFKRHYPRQVVDFAFDLFLGKPAFVVEHHGYFTDGGSGLERLVEQLRRIEPGLTWPTLTGQMTRSCFVRSVAVGQVDVQFYTREFRLRNTSDRPLRYSLAKAEPDPPVVGQVLVDGVSVPFVSREGGISFEVSAAPGRTITVKVEDRKQPPRGAFRASRRYRMGVGIRRLLSEARDEGAARHPGVLRAATRLARTLGVGAGG
jgi:hypothetical protein